MREVLNRNNRICLIGLIAMLMLVSSVSAAKAQNAEAAQPGPVVDVAVGMAKPISVNFRATPIEDVIRVFADQGQMDIVKSPEVIGEVTALITDIPLGEALDNILSVHGYGYIQTEHMIRIVPQSIIDAKQEKLKSKVYRVTYADVADVEKALQRFVSAEGQISSNAGTSNIIVSETEEKIGAIDQFMAEIDRITPQIMVEARIYDISSTDQLDLGIEWRVGRNTLYDPVTGAAVGGATDPSIFNSFESSIGRTTKTAAGLLSFGIMHESLNLEAVLSAKQDDICATLLANPRIMVLDNETASIKIVSELPYQELTQTSDGGSIGTTSFKDVGVELEVTPHITRDGMIRLKLAPKFSVQVDSVAIAIPGSGGTSIVFPQPVVDTRETTTTALIGDGQVVVIGGMRKKDSIQEVSKIPLLGDIPLLGELFKYRGEKTVNSELVVFIKPTIVIDTKLSEAESRHLEASENDLCTPQCAPKLIDDCAAN